MTDKIVIDVKNIYKTFGSFRAVNDFSFSVNEASCFGFLGPNGAGKTTLMKMLYGKAICDKNKNTSINVFGYNPLENELPIKYLSGIVPQQNNLDEELNVLQNLFIFSKFYGIKKTEAQKRIESLIDFMELTPKKDSKIKHLSGGMQRRLVIARSLLNNPKLLILDEPTTGLDPQVRHLIWNKLRQLKKQGVTILLTTHYMEEAFQLCDQIIIMHNGEKVISGSPQALLKKDIESYVLEIFYNNQLQDEKTIDTSKVRLEKIEEKRLLYSNDINALQEISEKLQVGDYYLRQSNLEDLFLKTTGRGLNEK